jgi:p-cumate 2,3-dioxygenase subunit beta
MTTMQTINRETIETFLYREADLLDRWQLTEWLTLFTPDAYYQVPPLDARELPPEQALYLVDDNYQRLHSRIKQLLKGNAHSESPPSRTRRSVTNVMFEVQPNSEVHVRANFIIHRVRRETLDVYMGRYDHILVPTDGQLRFRLRKAVLDLDALRPQGKVSIII